MNKLRVVGISIGIILVAGLLETSTNARLSAQDNGSPTAAPTVPPTATALPTPTAFPLQKMAFNLLTTTEVQLVSDGPSFVRAATITVSPGTTSLPFTNEGPTVLAVTAGKIVLASDQAVVSVTDIAFVAGLVPVAGTPGPIDDLVVGPGEQIYLPGGSTTTIRNDTTAPATLLIVAVVPFPGPTPTP